MTGEDTGNPNSPEEDYQRMESYNRGNWAMIGIKAIAEIAILIKKYTPTIKLIQVITSGGIWGIESDQDSFKEYETSQLDELKDVLEALNVDLSRWDELTKGIEAEA